VETLNKIIKIPDLRNKIIIVAVILGLTRVLAHIPLPGVDPKTLSAFFQQNQVLGLLDLFSGGTMSQFSVILMGVGPYITASIIFQLLVMVIPSLEELQKEGESGQNKINQYTRIATVPLALIQSYSMLALLKSQGVIPEWGIFELSVMLISSAAGTMLLMWLGEIISEKSVGNGISLIITIGILSGVPQSASNTWALVQSGDISKIIGVIAFVAILVVVVAAIIFITEGQRNIPVSYARRSSSTIAAKAESHLPIRVNIAGVIPIIFAMSILVVPGVLGKYLELAKTDWIKNSATYVVNLFQNNWFYGIAYFVLVFLFTFFYTYVVFKPDQISENLQRQGGFIPGLRPGSETKAFLSKVVTRITFAGGLFLAIIAVLPYVVQAVTNINTIVLGGTGILIVVAVVIESMKQINAQILMHTYDNY
jgi:preprotein translocase subunit SecY